MEALLSNARSLEDIFTAVVNIVAETKTRSPDGIRPESSFEELAIDSLDALNIFFAVEEYFDISVPDEEAQRLRSISEVVARIDQALKSTDASRA